MDIALPTLIIAIFTTIWIIVQFLLENTRSKKEQKVALRTPIYLELLSSLGDIQGTLEIMASSKMEPETDSMTAQERKDLKDRNREADRAGAEAVDKLRSLINDLKISRLKILSFCSVEIDNSIKNVLDAINEGMVTVYQPGKTIISRRETLWHSKIDDLLFEIVLRIREELEISSSEDLKQVFAYPSYEELDFKLEQLGIILSDEEKEILKAKGSVPYKGKFLSAHKLRSSPLRLIWSQEE